MPQALPFAPLHRTRRRPRQRPPSQRNRDGRADVEDRRLASRATGSRADAARHSRGARSFGADNVRRPQLYSGLGLLTVLTVDLAKGLALVDTDSIVADGRTVYASQKSLYVATQRWFPQPAGPTPPTPRGHDGDPQVRHLRPRRDALPGQRQRLRLPDEPVVALRARGRPPRREHRGADLVEPRPAGAERELRHDAAGAGAVPSSSSAGSAASARASASTPSASTATRATSSPSGRSTRSTRSTSRQPSRPAVLGELKIRGYSAYLHPIGDDLLLGIGQDASDEGACAWHAALALRRLGPSPSRATPHLRARLVLVGGRERPSRIPLVGSPRGSQCCPCRRTARSPSSVRSASASAAAASSRPAGSPTSGEPPGRVGTRVAGIPIRRSAVVGDTLYTVSDQGVKATALASFADEGWVAFPASTAGGTTPQR